MKRSVFITDGHWRKSLAAVRALGREGVSVTVGESTRLATAAFSRYCTRAVTYPSPLFHPEEFSRFVHTVLQRGDYRMLLPMEDETLDILSQRQSELSRWTYVPVVSHEKLRFARQKDRVLLEAHKLGIPIPKTWFIGNVTEIQSLKGELEYPVVIKPRVGSGAEGIAYPENAQVLVAQYQAIHRRYPYPLVQERIPVDGPGYGASFLLDERGEVKASFVHRRLREYPVTGGASTLRESVRRDDLRDMGAALLKALGWFGVAMVEFKMDPRDGRPKLMEVNPRFWGSLALAIASGVNFPHLLYRMACGEQVAPVEHYRVGVRCRWLLPGDILHFISSPNRGRLMPDFFRFRDSNTVYDILSLRDPMPVIGRILTPLTFLYDRDMKTRLRRRRA